MYCVTCGTKMQSGTACAARNRRVAALVVTGAEGGVSRLMLVVLAMFFALASASAILYGLWEIGYGYVLRRLAPVWLASFPGIPDEFAIMTTVGGWCIAAGALGLCIVWFVVRKWK